MTDKRETASRAHFAVARDLAISAGVLVYFLGFVYLYYYLTDFGVSLVAVQLAPQHIFMFAYGVVTHDPLITIPFLIVVVVAASAYSVVIDKYAVDEPPTATNVADNSQTKQKEAAPFLGDGSTEPAKASDAASDSAPASSALTQPARRALPRPAARWLVIGVAICCLATLFPTAFAWARHVARADGILQLQAIHEGSHRFLKVVEVQDGPLATSSQEFRAIVARINRAGAQGRAIQVGESADRIFILVGAMPRSTDDPLSRLPDDRVFAIDKSLIAVEEGL